MLDLQPQMLWQIFSEICAIPHPSGHEAALRAHLQAKAKVAGLTTQVDQAGNLLIEKPATPGRKNTKTVILQAHLDMVPQKNTGVKYRPTQDPIKTVIENGWITTGATTSLGADNGIGIAAAMAIMLSDELEHGPLKTLLTVSEETGLDGAKDVDPAFLEGDILLNLDSEEEGQIFIGCAGGSRLTCSFKMEWESLPPQYRGLKIGVSGLQGGHSGVDIHLGRGNAIKLLNGLLGRLAAEVDARISIFDGGTLDNAIPRNSFAVLSVPAAKKRQACKIVKNYAVETKNKLQAVEPELEFRVVEWETPSMAFVCYFQKQVLHALDTCPNGVIAYNEKLPEQVATSTNLAVIETGEDFITVKTMQRSSCDKARLELAENITKLFNQAGATAVADNEYPGWETGPDSEILRLGNRIYRDLLGKKPENLIIHAGLECGILRAINPRLDIISLGPTMRNPHSPYEKVEIKSVETFFNALKMIVTAV